MPSTISKERLDSRLQRIANVLLLNASFIDNLGLLNGKMGIAIFFFHYAKYTGNEVYETYAGELIDEIYEEINTSTPVDFANGLTGIGWGIEYLVQNGFVEADTDEALEEMDHKIYKARLDRPILIENSNDLFGFGFYYLSRIRSRENDDENINTLIKKHQLIFLTDECERLLIHKRYLEFNISMLSIASINSLTYFLLEMDWLALFPSKINKLYRYLPSYMEFSLHKESDLIEKSTLLHLVQSIRVKDIEVQKKYTSITNKLKKECTYIINDPQNDVIVTYYIKLALHRLMYAPYSLNSSTIQRLTQSIISIINDEVYWDQLLNKLNKNNLGLTGLAGIGWGLLINVVKDRGENNEGTERSKVEILN